MFGAFQTFGRMGAAGGAATWSPAKLFAAGEAGGLWDFSSLANLYQDSAGTTPCTDAGDPIGKVLDTSGRGNHLTQATATKRPTVGYDSGTGKYYAIFDGVDDCLVSPSIDFTASDKMTTCAGVKKNSDATSMIFELSAGIGGNPGSFYMVGGLDAYPSTTYSTLGRGSTSASSLQSAYTASPEGDAPDNAVITASHDISGDLTSLWRNGVIGTVGTGDKGSGNFGDYVLYVGQRAGSSLPFSGNISALIIRGAATDAVTRGKMDSWVASCTPGVTLP